MRQQTIAVLVAVVLFGLGGCHPQRPGGSSSSSSSGGTPTCAPTCAGLACPTMPSEPCPDGVVLTTCCAPSGGVSLPACLTPRGFLTPDCGDAGVCASHLCARIGQGPPTCCDFSAPSNPCFADGGP